ncbi:MAG: S9 family peptidase [Gemmatimonadales bacterium]|nr:MAG: S9 family peptidase [Gemmatimonadales bacterium]
MMASIRPVLQSTGALRLSFALFLACVLAFLAPAGAHAQAASPDEGERRLLTPADYGKFESLGQTMVSPDGHRIAVTVSRFDEDGEVRFLSRDGSEVRVVENGTAPAFAAESGWIGVRVNPDGDTRDALREKGEPVRSDLLLFHPDSDREVEVETVQGFDFSPDGTQVLVLRHPRSGNDHSGRDVLVRDLETGVETNFGNVSEASWAREGATLVMIVDAEAKAGNAIRVLDAHAGTLRTLHQEPVRYQTLTWRDDSDDLAVFRWAPDEERGDTTYSVLAWRDALSGDSEPYLLEAELDRTSLTGPVRPGEEPTLRVVPNRSISWSEDGDRIRVGLRPRPADPEAEGEEGEEDADADDDQASDDEDPPGVEIWHAADVDPVPQQRIRANMERNRSLLASWELGGGVVALGGDDPEVGVRLEAGDRWAILTDQAPWARERMFGPVFQDIHVLDVHTGEVEPALERIEFFQGMSPDGRYLLWFNDEHYHALDRDTGEELNLTAGLPTNFANEQVDVVVPQQPPHGTTGWSDDGRWVFVHDRWDLWRIALDGSGGERLTRGAEDQVRHRMVRFDWSEPTVPAEGPHVVSLYGQWTKESGYARVEAPGEVEVLVWEDRSVGRLSRADDEETFTFVRQRHHEPPALYVTDESFGAATRVTSVNPFVEEYHWSRGELVDFTNQWGVELQAALYYPADYDPDKTYPMVVYHYERVSQGLHNWTNPSDRNAYNTTAFTQAGYFVLQPDIVYRPRDPGRSAMAAILPAVDAALEVAPVDPEAIGIMGHSWGGYQTTFAVTQTDRFAAAVAGAPLTNLMSMYLSFYWNTGSTDARIFEISQGRMEVPWWEDYEAYRANSPVHHIENMNTPLLMAFGTEDGAVEFNQGVEFYNAARRADRDFVLLVYEGENHSLARRPNQLDYHRRTLEWFDHYLKGEPAPVWITEGVPFLEQQEKLEKGPAAGRRR